MTINLCCLIYPQFRIYYVHFWYFTWRNSFTEKLNNFLKVIASKEHSCSLSPNILIAVFLPILLESCVPLLLILSAFIPTKHLFQSLHPGPPLSLPRCRSQTKVKQPEVLEEECLQFYWSAGRAIKGNICSWC